MIRNRSSSPIASQIQHEVETGSTRGKKRIKRSRAVLVCARCKSLKTKCDLNEPCGNCTKAKVGDKCVYDHWRDSDHKQSPSKINTIHSTHSTNPGDPGPSSLENRMNLVENHLLRIESLLSRQTTNHDNDSNDHNRTKYPEYTSNGNDDDQWSYLISQLPPYRVAEQLLENYSVLDTLLRYTHQPSYLRQFYKIYPRKNQDHQTITKIKKKMAPYLASLCLAMVIGSTIKSDDLDNDNSENDFVLCSASLVDTLLSLHCKLTNISENMLISKPEYRHDPEISYYHVHSLMLGIQRSMMDNSSSLPQTWFKLGKIFNTALWLDFHVDPDDLQVDFTPFWKELRRRIWWLLGTGEKIAAQKLRLPTLLPPSTSIRKPIIIPDDDLKEDISQNQLDDQVFLSHVFELPNSSSITTTTSIADLTPPEILIASTGRSAPAEWAFIDSKIKSTEIMAELFRLIPKSSSSSFKQDQHQLPDIDKVDKLIEQFEDNIPSHLKFEIILNSQLRHYNNNNSDMINQPPWLLAQACIMNIGISSVILNAYQPYLTSNNVDLVEHALKQSLIASHKLIVTSEIFIWHITFNWSKGKFLFSWNLGSKILSAGSLLAFTIIRNQLNNNTDNNSTNQHKNGNNLDQNLNNYLNDLNSAENLLKILSNHTCNSIKRLSDDRTNRKHTQSRRKEDNADFKALKILRQLSDRAKRSFSSSNGHNSRPIESSSTEHISEGGEPMYDPYTTEMMSDIPTPNVSDTSSRNDNNTLPGNFTLEDLEALLTQVYGSPKMS
ncbi:uncharacterized protein L201_001419 [Kwoniella dendrophila CBS 6074]|uniref:Zn(2)-C6 fungal-type domain-containing protein n=1 Tax=Kwoniella dendrophila CBS 6074 TaxID=1295534 RepID=A0AAX4JM82_9TREE